MTNMMDYLAWRGDLTFDQAPFCEIDALILAAFSYNELGDRVRDAKGMPLRDLAPLLNLKERRGNAFFTQRRDLLYAMAESARYGRLIVHDYEDDMDEALHKQFGAVSVTLPDGNEAVAFRGTNSTLVGWHEDFNMCFASPVPAQQEAVDYLNRIAAGTDGRIITTGHSKGGNLAAWAAAFSNEDAKEKLCAVYSFDGPGFEDGAADTDGYRRVEPMIHSIIPESSVIGLMLNSHQGYEVVKSDAVSLLQHDAFKWHVKGPAFERAGEVNLSSRIIDGTVRSYLAEASREERAQFVSTIFRVLEATGATTTGEISASALKSAASMVTATASLDEKQKNLLFETISRMITLGLQSTKEQVTTSMPERLRELGGRLISGVQDISSTIQNLADQAGIKTKDGGNNA